MTGYRETARGRFFQREAAGLVVPLIISFGTPFLIALSREPDAADRQPSFAAGLHAGPVFIESDGGAECVQVDFTPLGAYRFFGGAVVDLTARMVDMSDVLGREGRALRERLGAASGWENRFDLVEDFVAGRASHLPSPEIEYAYRRLARSAGGARIAALAREIGWSRKHLVNRFRSELGLAPKPIARMMRFHRACGLARGGARSGWADDCGGERLRRPGASRPRICSPRRRNADGLGPASGLHRQPPVAPAGRARRLTVPVTNLQAWADASAHTGASAVRRSLP